MLEIWRFHNNQNLLYLCTDGKPVSESQSVSLRTQNFITAKSLLLSLADAMERVMSSYKEVCGFVPG